MKKNKKKLTVGMKIVARRKKKEEMQLKTILMFEDDTLNKAFGGMESTQNSRATVRGLYREARNTGFSREDARLLGIGAAYACGFWTEMA